MILLTCLPLQEKKKFPSLEKGRIQICNKFHSKISGFFICTFFLSILVLKIWLKYVYLLWQKKSFYDHIAVSCIRTMSSVLKNILL